MLGVASEPAKSAFFRLRVIGGMERSTGIVELDTSVIKEAR